MHLYGTQNFAPIYSSATELTDAYSNGTYDFFINGATPSSQSLSLGGGVDQFPTVPLLTVAGASWSGGELILDRSSTYTFSFTNPGLGAGDFVALWLPGGGYNTYLTETASFSVDASIINANGGLGRLIFRNQVDLQSGFGGIDNGFAGFETTTFFYIAAIPEPSTYAAILGLIAMGFVAYCRRRKVA